MKIKGLEVKMNEHTTEVNLQLALAFEPCKIITKECLQDFVDDQLANLLHFADLNELDFERALKMARKHFNAEKE